MFGFFVKNEKKDDVTFLKDTSIKMEICPEFSDSLKSYIETIIGKKTSYLDSSIFRYEIKTYFDSYKDKTKAVNVKVIFRLVHCPKKPEKRFFEVVTVEDFGSPTYHGNGKFSYNFPSFSIRYLCDIDNFKEHWDNIWANISR